MYYGPRVQSSLSRRAWAAGAEGVVDMSAAEDLANSSPSTSGYSTPWSASLQRSQARRRLDHLDDRGDDDDDEDGGTSTPTPLRQPPATQRPAGEQPPADWPDWRSRRRRRPARSSDLEQRGRSPHVRSSAAAAWADERRSLDACDPQLLAVMAAAAQPWIAAAAAASSPPATPCCCSPPPACAAGGPHGGCPQAWAAQRRQQQQQQRVCPCGSASAGANWALPAAHCGHCCAEQAPPPHVAAPCHAWIGAGRCRVRARSGSSGCCATCRACLGEKG